MTESAPKLFISYRREETASHAGRLYDAMAARFGERNEGVYVCPGRDRASSRSRVAGHP